MGWDPLWELSVYVPQTSEGSQFSGLLLIPPQHFIAEQGYKVVKITRI